MEWGQGDAIEIGCTCEDTDGRVGHLGCRWSVQHRRWGALAVRATGTPGVWLLWGFVSCRKRCAHARSRELRGLHRSGAGACSWQPLACVPCGLAHGIHDCTAGSFCDQREAARSLKQSIPTGPSVGWSHVQNICPHQSWPFCCCTLCHIPLSGHVMACTESAPVLERPPRLTQAVTGDSPVVWGAWKMQCNPVAIPCRKHTDVWQWPTQSP